jgi:hypothetical protein
MSPAPRIVSIASENSQRRPRDGTSCWSTEATFNFFRGLHFGTHFTYRDELINKRYWSPDCSELRDPPRNPSIPKHWPTLAGAPDSW